MSSARFKFWILNFEFWICSLTDANAEPSGGYQCGRCGHFFFRALNFSVYFCFKFEFCLRMWLPCLWTLSVAAAAAAAAAASGVHGLTAEQQRAMQMGWCYNALRSQTFLLPLSNATWLIVAGMMMMSVPPHDLQKLQALIFNYADFPPVQLLFCCCYIGKHVSRFSSI